jgi:hypothetical protein
MFEVLCFTLTLLTAVSLHCYSFSTQFPHPALVFPYTHLGMAYKKLFMARLKQKYGENCIDCPSMQLYLQFQRSPTSQAEKVIIVV